MSVGFVTLSRVIGGAMVAMMLFAGCGGDHSTDNSWTQKASMEISRSEIPVAVVGGTIYVPGGLVSTPQGVGVAASVERYHPETDVWESVADMPAARHHSMSVSADEQIYVLGGFGDAFDPWATAWVFEPQTNEWSEIADLPLSVGAGAAVELGGLIYLAGGVPLGTSLYVYDPAEDTWQTMANMTQPREHTAAVAFGGDLWVIGGRWQEEMLSSVEIFDPDSGSWSNAPDMAEARSGFGATVLNDNIFVAGGEVFDHSNGFQATALDSVERFDGEAWVLAESLPRRLHGVPMATVDDVIYVLGGSIEPAGVDNPGEVWSLQP